MKPLQSSNQQVEFSGVASFGQSGGECAQRLAQPSPLTSEYCLELLRDLNNTFAAVLMNAQVLDGKLPSYSRSKRYIHEIERSAQRGGAKLKGLLGQLSAEGTHRGDRESEVEKVPPVRERTAVVANQGPTAAVISALDLAPSAAAHVAP
jgi:hypothetical protein